MNLPHTAIKHLELSNVRYIRQACRSFSFRHGTGRSGSIKAEKYNDYVNSNQICKESLAPFDQITTKVTRRNPHTWLGNNAINLGEM